MRHKIRASRSGFTLLEILLVVVIIGMLVTVAAINIVPRLGEAQETTARQQIQTYNTGIELYLMHVGSYPTTEQGLESLISAPGGAVNWRGPYLKPPVIRDDPWHRKYIYRYPGERNSSGCDIFSAGPDGIPGNDDDIGNWQ